MPYGKPESDILFTRSVKAGKRIYYVDVKQDRNGEYYVALTESKRVKDGTEEAPPQFEKHKIFIYRTDIERFRNALDEATAFIGQENIVREDVMANAFPAEEEFPAPLPQVEEGDNFSFEF
ncbi:MAG: DUF3276 family protein [Alloprevotella sp.]|nr:DUF3276 family protein [Alloprevotella sp.]MBR1651819.1 DUF3276 family protein [Alloprevotella sp.]